MLSLLDDACVRARELTYLRGVPVICIRCLFCDMYHVLTGEEWLTGARRQEYHDVEDIYATMYGAQTEPRFEPRIREVIDLHIFLFPHIASQYRAGAILRHSLDALSWAGGPPENISVAHFPHTPSEQLYLDSSSEKTFPSDSASSDQKRRSEEVKCHEQGSTGRPIFSIVTDILLDASGETETMSLHTLHPVTFADGLRGISPRNAISPARIAEYNRLPRYYYGEDLLDVSCREHWTLERRREMSRYEGYPGLSPIRIALLMARSFGRAFPWGARVLSTVTKAAEFLPAQYHPILADPFWLVLHPGVLNPKARMLRPDDCGPTPASANFTQRNVGIALPATLPERFTHQGCDWHERGNLPYQRQIQAFLEWVRTNPRSPSIYFDAVEEQDHRLPKFPDPSRVYTRTALSQRATPGPSRLSENLQITQSPTESIGNEDAPDRFDFSKWVHDSSPEPAPSITTGNENRIRESEYLNTPHVPASTGDPNAPHPSLPNPPNPEVEFQRFLRPTTGQLISRYSIRENSDLAFMRDRAWAMRSGYEGTLWG